MKILLEHLKNNQEILLKMSKSSNLAQHSGNLGTAREGIISNFLELNLPENIKYHTGEIFDSKDMHSGQLDIIIHPISSPKLNLYGAINLFPIETILAVIEVKSNLTTSKLNEALDLCKRTKKLQNHNNATENKFNGIPFIIFAYKGSTVKTLMNNLEKALLNNYKLWELPELIINLERGYYLEKNIEVSINAGAKLEDIYTKHEKNDTVLLGLYVLLLSKIEKWFTSSKQEMPINHYIKDYNNPMDKWF